MFDNGANALALALREITQSQLRRLHPFPQYRLPRPRKTSGVRNETKYGFRFRWYSVQGQRERTRRMCQMEDLQLDFLASGQPEIKGYNRVIREGFDVKL